MATSKDIAERSGVSRATVSAVVNGNKYVSAELRRRVLEAIAELDYHPDTIARSLKTQRTQTIGLVIPDIREPFFPAVARGVEDCAQRAGYTVLLCNTDSDAHKEQAFLRVLRQRRVDGVILVSCGDRNRDIIARFMESEIPIVAMDRTVDGLPMDSVVADNVTGAFRAVDHLLGTGKRRVAILNMSPELSYARELLAGYKQALASHGLPFEEGLVGVCQDTIADASTRVIALWSRRPQPDALFVSGSMMIIGALEGLGSLGLKVPGDVALVGYDDLPWVAYLSPPVTVVTQPTYELGVTATSVLLDRINGVGMVAPRHIVLPVDLVIRRSCGCQ